MTNHYFVTVEVPDPGDPDEMTVDEQLTIVGESVPEAIKALRINSVISVHLDDDEMTEVCQLHGTPVECERCTKLENGTFPSSEIRLL